MTAGAVGMQGRGKVPVGNRAPTAQAAMALLSKQTRGHRE